MPWKSLQPFAHVNKRLHSLVRLIEIPKLRIHGQGLIYGNIQLIGDHFGDSVALGVRQVHNSSHVPDNASGRHGTKGNNLYQPVLAIFAHHVINDLLTPFKAEVYVNIRHGYSLRVQKTFKKKIVFNGIQLGDSQCIGYQASCCRSTSRTHHNVVVPGVLAKVPYNKEVVHISHLSDNAQLQPFLQLVHILCVALFQSFIAQLIQVLPGSIGCRHIKFRQLGHAKLDLYITPVCDLLSI